MVLRLIVRCCLQKIFSCYLGTSPEVLWAHTGRRSQTSLGFCCSYRLDWTISGSSLQRNSPVSFCCLVHLARTAQDRHLGNLDTCRVLDHPLM
jgi:hypothetical protein